MARTFNCKKCGEHTVYALVSFDKDDNYGDFRRCNLCNDITPMVRRMTEKKQSRIEMLNRLEAEWLGSGCVIASAPVAA